MNAKAPDFNADGNITIKERPRHFDANGEIVVKPRDVDNNVPINNGGAVLTNGALMPHDPIKASRVGLLVVLVAFAGAIYWYSKRKREA